MSRNNSAEYTKADAELSAQYNGIRERYRRMVNTTLSLVILCGGGIWIFGEKHIIPLIPVVIAIIMISRNNSVLNSAILPETLPVGTPLSPEQIKAKQTMQATMKKWDKTPLYLQNLFK